MVLSTIPFIIEVMQKDSEPPVVVTAAQQNLLSRLTLLNIESIAELTIHQQVQQLLSLELTHRETRQLLASIERMMVYVQQTLLAVSALSIKGDEEAIAVLLEKFQDSLEIEIGVERAGVEDAELPEQQIVIEELLGYQDALNAFMSEALEVLQDVSLELVRAISDLDEDAIANLEYILQKPHYSFVTTWTRHLVAQEDVIH